MVICPSSHRRPTCTSTGTSTSSKIGKNTCTSKCTHAETQSWKTADDASDVLFWPFRASNSSSVTSTIFTGLRQPLLFLESKHDSKMARPLARLDMESQVWKNKQVAVLSNTKAIPWALFGSEFRVIPNYMAWEGFILYLIDSRARRCFVSKKEMA